MRTWLEEMGAACAEAGCGVRSERRLLYGSGHVQHFGVVLGGTRAWPGMPSDICRAIHSAVGASAIDAELPRRHGQHASSSAEKRSWTRLAGSIAMACPRWFSTMSISALKIHEAGFRNVVTPHAELFHLESVTRGTLASEEGVPGFQGAMEKPD